MTDEEIIDSLRASAASCVVYDGSDIRENYEYQAAERIIALTAEIAELKAEIDEALMLTEAATSLKDMAAGFIEGRVAAVERDAAVAALTQIANPKVRWVFHDLMLVARNFLATLDNSKKETP